MIYVILRSFQVSTKLQPQVLQLLNGVPQEIPVKLQVFLWTERRIYFLLKDVVACRSQVSKSSQKSNRLPSFSCAWKGHEKAGKGLHQSLGDRHSCQRASSGAHLIQLSIQPEGWRKSHNIPKKRSSHLTQGCSWRVPFFLRAITAIAAVTAVTTHWILFAASYTCILLEDIPELCTRFSCSWCFSQRLWDSI